MLSRSVFAAAVAGLLAFGVSDARADWGIFSDADSWNGSIAFKKDGGSDTWVNRASLDSYSYGSVERSGGSLVLNVGQLKTWKTGVGDVTGAKLNYRVYKVGDTPGSFTEVNLPWKSDDGGGNQTWEGSSLAVNLMTGITTNDSFTVEIYWRATGTDGGPETSQYLSNGGSNYKSGFASLPVTLSGLTID